MVLYASNDRLGNEEPANSPTLRGRVCVVAQKFGVGLDDSMGSKPDSQMYVDWLPRSDPEGHRATCRVKTFPRMTSGMQSMTTH